MPRQEPQILSWGRAHRFRQESLVPDTLAQAASLLQTRDDKTMLALGCGRSYGDSCLNDGGYLLATRRLDYFVAFDRETGILTAEPGVRLADILPLCHRPNADGSYWFLPVSPGTKFVTLGGAIANDVHGKNHHVRGTFGHHVLGFELYRSDGSCLTCSATENAPMFHATIGGLGLTGLIGRIRLQLMRVSSPWLEVEDTPFGSLDDFFVLSQESAAREEYSVAWIDCLATGAETGRGIFSSAKHRTQAPGRPLPSPRHTPKITVPFAPPISPLNPYTLRLFNACYRNCLGTEKRRSIQNYEPFFYPLDSIGHWNRLYGRAGFYQYQCVLPPETARRGIAELLAAISAAEAGSFLAVLKVFGDRASLGLLSFPRPGVTLALDFANRGPQTLALLDRLDAITLSAGGRLYPGKDGRMSAQTFQTGYPRWQEFAIFTDPHLSSSFWRRVNHSQESPA